MEVENQQRNKFSPVDNKTDATKSNNWSTSLENAID